MESTFTAFNRNQDGLLSIEDFSHLSNALFRNEKGRAYKLEGKWLQEIFNIFDKNGDKYIDKEEFELCWEKWIKSIICPVSALVIVDVQNDFISGSLSLSNGPAQQNAHEIIEPINTLLDTVQFEAVFYTLDWHPNKHISFIENLPLRKIHPSSSVTAETARVTDTVIFVDDENEDSVSGAQVLWPRHCVQDTWGSELHKDLKVLESGIKIYKGSHPNIDSYSGFWDNNKKSSTKLDSELKSRCVTDVYVCGLVYDVCVKSTAFDALELGYRTVIIDDCSRGLNFETIEEVRHNFRSQHGVIVKSTEVESMVESRIRRPEMGYKLAMNLKKDAEVAINGLHNASSHENHDVE